MSQADLFTSAKEVIKCFHQHPFVSACLLDGLYIDVGQKVGHVAAMGVDPGYGEDSGFVFVLTLQFKVVFKLRQ